MRLRNATGKPTVRISGKDFPLSLEMTAWRDREHTLRRRCDDSDTA
jgi:hypothetical protein